MASRSPSFWALLAATGGMVVGMAAADDRPGADRAILESAGAAARAQAAGGVRGEALRDYVIGAGDLLQIEVFELEELSKTVRVSGDGSITYPMVGTVAVGGLTKADVEKKLGDLLESKFVRNPQVTVFLKEMQASKVSVVGAVHDPGGFGLIGDKTVLDALGMAGGVTREAGTRAFLIRAGSDAPTLIDMTRLLEAGDMSQNARVTAGDVIYVPRAKTYRVFVYGQVEKPGAFEIQEGERVTILQAVAMAGGLARRASAGKTKVVHAKDGERKMVKVDLNGIIDGKDPDMELAEGDIVVVPKSFF